jgi:hypothetical protein
MGLRIPQNIIVTSKYTSGKEYMFVSTYREYIGYYYEMNSKLFAGKEFNNNAPELISITSNQVNKLLTNPDTYIYGRVSGTKIAQATIESSVFVPTEEDYQRGFKTRYFIKKLNTGSIFIKEVNKTTFEQIQSDPLYQALEANVRLYPTDNDLNVLDSKMLGLKDYLQSEALLNISETYSIGNEDVSNFSTQPSDQSLPEFIAPTGSITDTPAYQDIVPIGTSYRVNYPIKGLRLMWIDIANVPVGNPLDVNDWNYFFELISYPSKQFTSVQVNGDEVVLVGGNNISIVSNLFLDNLNLVSIIDEINCIVNIGRQSFFKCNSLVTVTLPSVLTAGLNAFYGCVALLSVNLPSLTTAGNTCFYSCTALLSINLPSLTSAGTNCFNYCSAATLINLPKLPSVSAGLFTGCTSVQIYNLQSITTLSNSYFSKLSNVITFNLDKLGSAGNYVFEDCTSAKTIYTPSLTSAGDGCFLNCSSVTSYTLPQLKSIGDYCFQDNTSCLSFSLPELTSTGDEAFVNCNSSTSFSLPKLDKIPNYYYFENCLSATYFDLPLSTTLGATTGDNSTFLNITGKTITIVIKAVAASDGDITYLQTHGNAVTVIPT